MPQKRHRHTYRGITWDPSSDTKALFLQSTMQQLPQGMQPLCQPLAMHLKFDFKRPKSHLTKKGNLTKRAPLQHVQTPDCDNLAKLVMDACNGHVYVDDKQICQLTVTKTWAKEDATHVNLYAVVASA